MTSPTPPPTPTPNLSAIIAEARRLIIEGESVRCACPIGNRTCEAVQGGEPCPSFLALLEAASRGSAAPCGVCGCLPGVNRATGKNRYFGEDALAFIERQIEADEAKQLTEMDELRTALREAEGRTCAWSFATEFFDDDTYESACGETWSFVDGGVSENRVRFCHGCGGKVIPPPTPAKETK